MSEIAEHIKKENTRIRAEISHIDLEIAKLKGKKEELLEMENILRGLADKCNEDNEK